jgi:hypothetical protein
VSAVPQSVPSAVAPSAKTSVPVNTQAQLGPYQPMSGSAVNPVVPRSGEPLDQKELTPQPGYGNVSSSSSQKDGGGDGSPSVPPMGGALFTPGPIDAHYVSEAEQGNPYFKVNNPATRGMWTRIQEFANHIAMSQNTTNTGFKVNGPQQRTSFMRNQLPNLGAGYAPETFTPKQLPQSDNTQKFLPSTGTDTYGTGVLNSSTFGAGQTAGGIGGNLYTPAPGPPDTNSTAQAGNNVSGMPAWG